LKGRRDRDSGLGEKGNRGRKGPEKISHFLFGIERRKLNFVVPKAKQVLNRMK
jgi:hypothetical protein